MLKLFGHTYPVKSDFDLTDKALICQQRFFLCYTTIDYDSRKTPWSRFFLEKDLLCKNLEVWPIGIEMIIEVVEKELAPGERIRINWFGWGI